VFWKKRLQSIENKGCELQKERQESSRGAKPLRTEGLVEIEEVEKVRKAARSDGVDDKRRDWRVFTGYDTKNYRICQYIK
jgi:hypothetical protein